MRQCSRANHETEDQREEVHRIGEIHHAFGIGKHRRVALDHAERLFQHLDLLQRLTIHQLRDRHAGHLHRQDDHRDQVGDDQDDILRHLGPGNRAHTAQHRADQNAGKTNEHRNLERDAEEARSDDANAENLRRHIGEGRRNQHDHTSEAGQIAAIPGAEEVRHGILAELAQVRRQQDRHQQVAAGPAEHKGQAIIAKQVERTGHADERRGAHPVGTGGHAVIKRRHTAAGDVVFAHFRGA